MITELSFTVDIASCHPHSCDSPPAILHGKYILFDGNTNFNSSAAYVCDSGYEMVENAQNILRCAENKLWGPPPIPVCLPKDCGAIACPEKSKYFNNILHWCYSFC